MKIKLIEVLNMIENKSLQDDERVIIDNELYYFNHEDKKFYTVSSEKNQNTYIEIYTNKLDLECELIDRVTKIGSIEELKLVNSVNFKNMSSEERFYVASQEYNKINELVREVNNLKDKINN